ncbi:MAG: phosphate regulon sensor histidine kinase PhoR [Gammaproteobacteria bacterium]|nr:phosphate regulon sensor histidine kinase PhoR [Gammaproteobacteria bacterium]
MQAFIVFLKSVLQVALVGIFGYAFGTYAGHALLGLSLALGAGLFWQLFSGQRLLFKISEDESLSELPLTLTDAELSTTFASKQRALKKTTKRNRRLQNILDEAAEASPLGLVIVDRDNRIRWINSKARKYLDIRDPEDIGKRIETFVHELHFIASEDKKQTAGDNSEHLTSIEIDGTGQQKLRLRLSFTRFAKRYIMIAVQDVSNFYRVDRMRQDFIGNASHELRTPLTVMRGYVEEMLEDEQIPDIWNEPIEVMDKQVTRMQSIIQDMLTLSMLESRMSLASQGKVELLPLLKQIKSDLSAAFDFSHDVALNVSDTHSIKGEESELYSAFSNLLKNAILYSPTGSSVKITSDLSVDGLDVVFTDQGSGIPEESIRRLTERFYRVDSARGREQGGTGLGLAIVKHALMRHEAQLRVLSELGQGSQFICHFPKQRIV